MIDIVKFERGQIWYVSFKHPEAVGREKMKDRPYLILSVGCLSMTFCKITAVPLMTKDAITSPSQVLMSNNLRNQMNVICCEDIRTFDYTSDNYVFDYMGNVSNEVLEKVDVALSVYLGIHYSPITLQSLYTSMEAIIKSIEYLESQNSTKFTEEDVRDFANKLTDLVLPTINKETVTGIKNNKDKGTLVEKPKLKDNHLTEKPKVEDKTAKDSKPAKVTIRNTIRWDKENCKKFLSDCDNLPMTEVMKLWNITKKTSLYQMKHYVKNLLIRMESQN